MVLPPLFPRKIVLFLETLILGTWSSSLKHLLSMSLWVYSTSCS
jgi:hypothetical protein